MRPLRLAVTGAVKTLNSVVTCEACVIIRLTLCHETASSPWGERVTGESPFPSSRQRGNNLPLDTGLRS